MLKPKDRSYFFNIEMARYLRAENPAKRRGLQKLTHLTVEGSYFMEENFFSNLLTLPNLISLAIFDCQHLFDEQFFYIAQLKNLQSLLIRGSSSFPEMESVGKGFTENCLQYLHSLDQLTSLVLCGCFDLTDKGWQHLAFLQNLTRLELSPDESLPRRATQNTPRKRNSDH